MSKQTEALKLALEALEETRNALAWFYDSYPQDVTKKGNELLPHVETVLTAIREALAEQPAQQQCMEHGECFGGECIYPATQPAQQQEPSEYVQKVIDALYENSDPVSVEAAELLEQMTQQQEPVACKHSRYSVDAHEQTGHCYDCGAEGRMRFVVDDAPPKRTWVGLTRDERMSIINRFAGQDWVYAVEAIEAKLKDKNGY